MLAAVDFRLLVWYHKNTDNKIYSIFTFGKDNCDFVDKILFSQRLKERRVACGFTSVKALAMAYDSIFNADDPIIKRGDTDAGILGTLKKYENVNSSVMPSLEKVDNLCKLLDCDIDYLLGKIDHPKRIYETMYKECGLSDRATEQLVYWKEMSKMNVVNMILESANFDNALDYAKDLMEALPTYQQLSNMLQEKLAEVYSQPKPDDGYPSFRNLREAVKDYRLRYDIARLNLSEHWTFVIAELERLTKEKHNL